MPLGFRRAGQENVGQYILQILRDIALTIGERGYKINIPGAGVGGGPGDTCKPGVPGCGGAPPPPPTVPTK